jgi:hypothetical protein
LEARLFDLFKVVWVMLPVKDMKSITFKAGKNGNLHSALVPANRSEEARGNNTWGFVIAGTILLVTATFVCLLLLKA